MWPLLFYLSFFLYSNAFDYAESSMIWRRAPANDSTTRSNNTDEDSGTTSDDTSKVCIKGVKVGQFIIDTPNRSSIAVVGSNFLIQWKYSNGVSSPPKTIDIKIQKDGVEYIWDKYVVRNLSLDNGATAFMWKVQPLNDGPYKIRMVPEGKETYGIKQDEMPCFADGEVLVSDSFNL
jgi:hypothetical protein